MSALINEPAARLRLVPEPAPGADPHPDLVPGADPHADPVLGAILGAGVPEGLAAQLTEAVHACAVATARQGHAGQALHDQGCTEAPAIQEHGSDLLGVVEVLTATTARLEGVMLGATRDLTASNGQLLLAKRGLTSPDELNSTDRDAWRSRAKSITRGEIRAAIGWGEGETSDLVALSATPPAVLTPVRSALGTGEAPWRLARRFFRECSRLPHELTAAMANALFGNDPALAVTERLDSHGAFTGRPWVHKEFYRALDREVARAKAQAKLDEPDPDDDTTDKPTDPMACGDLWVRLDNDGTATLGLRCTTTHAASIAERIETAARLARAGGDPRPLNTLRTTIAVALLMHGTLREPNTQPPNTPDLIDVERTAQLDRILAGMPEATINVLVPLDTLLPHLQRQLHPSLFPDPTQPHCSTCQCTQHNAHPTTTADPGPQEDPAHPDTHATTTADPGPQEDPAHPDTHATTPADPGPPQDSAHPGTHPGAHATDLPQDSAHPTDLPPPQDPDGTISDGISSDGTISVGVGEAIGKHPHFLTGAQIRELALRPGTSIFRILTDPATGRYVERSTKAYRFDTAMRTHITYADQRCRAPSCTVPAAQCQFDHVQEFGTPDGETSEANGALAHGVDHQRKTEKLWDAIIHPNRDMTWTSLLGRIYRTKAFDYNQYSALLQSATDRITSTPPEEREAAINHAVYAALSYRPAREPLEAEDDWDWEEHDKYSAWDLISLSYIDPDGRRHPTPDPHIAAEERARITQTAPPRTQTPDPAAPESSGTPPTESPHTTAQRRQGTTPPPTSQSTPSPQASETTPAQGSTGRTPWETDPDDPPPF